MALLDGFSGGKGKGKGGKGSYGDSYGAGSGGDVGSLPAAPLSRPGARLPKLDFRFADEEDADELAALVNAAFAGDEAAQGGFRTRPRLDLVSLAMELESAQDLKWVVLETPVPEEQMVAAVAISSAARASSTGGGRTASLRCLCVLPAWQGKGAGSVLLARAEAVALSGLGCSAARVQVASPAASNLAAGQAAAAGPWLAKHGYAQVGGGCWLGDAWVEPTPYATWAKRLGTQAAAARPLGPAAAAAAPHAGLPAALELAQAFAHAFADLPDLGAASVSAAPVAPAGLAAPDTTVAEGEGLAALLQELLAPPPTAQVPKAQVPKVQAPKVQAPSAAVAPTPIGGGGVGLEALLGELMLATKAEAAGGALSADSVAGGTSAGGSGVGSGSSGSGVGGGGSGSSGGEDGMESLLGSLMQALATDAGKAEFSALAHAEASAGGDRGAAAKLAAPDTTTGGSALPPPRLGAGAAAAEALPATGIHFGEPEKGAATADAAATVVADDAPAAAAGDLESLMGSLMSALGTPCGRAEFVALVEEEDENVLGKPIIT